MQITFTEAALIGSINYAVIRKVNCIFIMIPKDAVAGTQASSVFVLSPPQRMKI